MGKLAQKEGIQTKQLTKPHNYGIDLLRCLSMLMIVVLHLYTQGGALSEIKSIAPNSLAYKLNYTVELICLGGVNLYGLISGYVMLEGSFKPRRLFGLWLQVVFVGLVLNVAALIFSPDVLSAETWIRACLPVSQREYWYFTCYTCVFLLSPILNRGIRALTEKQAAILLFGCLFVFAFLSGVGYSYNGDPFYIVGGYSALWLIALYVMGACLKQSGLFRKTKTGNLLLVMLLCLGVDLIWHFLPLPPILNESKVIASKFFDPPLVIFDLCLFSLMAWVQLHGERLKKLLLWVSPLTFSVYLITIHPLFWNLQKDSFRFAVEPSVWLTAPILLGCGIAIFVLCILADAIRNQLFRIVRVDALCLWAERNLRSLFDKFTRRLLRWK